MSDILRQIVAELRGSWRYRWYAVGTAWVTCFVGWLVVYSLPDTFESEATVYVDTKSILRPLLGDLTIGTDVLSEVEQVTSAMLGRPLLEKVANETDLHLRSESDKEFDAMIDSMRRRIEIENNPRIDRNLYTIKYQDESAKTAQAVVNSMLSIFVEDTLGANRDDARKAQDFLVEELDKLKRALETSEQQLATFKKNNVGLMPSESGDYFSRLQTEMRDLEETRGDLQLARRKRNALQEQMIGEAPTLNSASGIQSELDLRITSLRSRLEELQLRYTDQHPDVVSTKASLETLESQRKAQFDAMRMGEGTGVASDNPVFQNIQIELTNVNVEIETLLEKEQTQVRRVEKLQELIDVLPQVEAELSRLTRDYDVKRSQYQALLKSLEVAQLSESAEISDEAKFSVIDPPILPTDPIAPHRTLLLAGVLFLGIGVGCGLAYMINMTNPVFNDAVDLHRMTGLPVLGVVSVVKLPERERERFREVSGFGLSLVVLCLVFAAVLFLQDSGSLAVRSFLVNGF